MIRNCDECGQRYEADERNLKRGWGFCCSKSCAASKREKSRPGYNPIKVQQNNIRRVLWNAGLSNDCLRTPEGYRIKNGVAYDEFDDPVYVIDPYEESVDHGQE